jgi:hypothetical protein
MSVIQRRLVHGLLLGACIIVMAVNISVGGSGIVNFAMAVTGGVNAWLGFFRNS